MRTNRSKLAFRLAACLLLILLLHPCFVQAQQTSTITAQPTNQTVAVGGTATFEATAAGTAPLSYQWLSNSTNLADVGRSTGVWLRRRSGPNNLNLTERSEKRL